MTAKEFLKQYRDIEADIDALRELIDRIVLFSEYSNFAENPEYFGTKLRNERNKMGAELLTLIAVKHNIEFIISEIDDRQQQRVLRLHYINGYSFQRIANILHYTRENIFIIHRKALKSAESIMQQEREGKNSDEQAE